VTERLFSVLLHGFIQYLEAVRGKLESRGKMRRVSRPSILLLLFSTHDTPDSLWVQMLHGPDYTV